MGIYTLDGVRPTIDATAWVADTARVTGRVTLGAEAGIWFGSSLRGDIEPIVVGPRSNVQDNAVLHTEIGFPVVVGAGVTVGHLATLHGCTIGDDSLVGIAAVVLNGARIGRHCLVGAHARVTEGKDFPDGSLILGSPARVVRQLTPAEIEGIRYNARRYIANAALYRRGLVAVV